MDKKISETAPLTMPYVDIPSQINDDGIEIKETRGAKPRTSNAHGADAFSFNFMGGRLLKVKAHTLNITLATLTVLTTLMMVVTLPLLNNTVDRYHDFYPVVLYISIWFSPFFFILAYLNKRFINPLAETRPTVPHKTMALMGLLTAVNGVLVVYASDPKRTSGSLQALLSTASIPFTVVFRYILLRKGVGCSRLVCTGIVLIGLFIALEPEVFNINQKTGPVPDGAVTGAMTVVWPIVFLLGFLPVGILNAITEREMKKEQSESLLFLGWIQLYQSISLLLLFWTDFIPEFGAADSIQDFGRNMLYTLKCMYFADQACMTAVAAYFIFILAYCLSSLVAVLLVKYAEGAIWLVIVQALVTPLGSLFFTLFSVEPPPGQDHGKFHWAPNFDLKVAFRMVGLAILVPAVVFYNYFGERERERKGAQQSMVLDYES